MRKMFILGMTVLILSMSFAGCDDDDGDGDSNVVFGGGDSNISVQPDKLTLGGKVFTKDIDEVKGTLKYVEFEKDLSFEPFYSGSGSISNGTLSYIINIPDSDYLTDMDYLDYVFRYDYDNITANPPTVKFFKIEDLFIANSSEYYSISLEKVAGSGSMMSYSGAEESVFFIYVTDQTTISGTGKKETEYGYTSEYVSFNITLSKGWNAISEKWQMTANAGKSTGKLSLSKIIPDSSYTWVLNKGFNFGDY